MRSQALVLATLLLSGCAPHMIYLRADGINPVSDPVINQQFEMDRTVCRGDMQKANLSGVTFAGGGLAGLAASADRARAAGQVGQGCMAEKGYVLVKEQDAPVRSQELAAIAAEKARRDAAAAAAATPPIPPKKIAAKPRAKPPQPSPPPAKPVSQPSAN